MSDDMRTYNQHLAARNLSEALLMKYAQEASRASFPMYGDSQVDEAFEKLADRLGYRVFRVVPEVSPVREPSINEVPHMTLTREPVAVWRKFKNGNNFLDVKNRELFQASTEIELYAAPAAAE